MQFTMDSFENILSLSLTFFLTSFSPTYNTSLVYFVVVVFLGFALNLFCCLYRKLCFTGICFRFIILGCVKEENFINLKIKILYIYCIFFGFYYSINFNLKSLSWNFGFLLCSYVLMYFYCCSDFEERISGCNWWQSTASALIFWWITNRNNEIQIFIILFVIRLLGCCREFVDCDWIIDFRLLVTRREGLKWTGKYYCSLDINRFVTTP